VGCIKGAPKDVSTNKRYFAGFGKSIHRDLIARSRP
jgi:hypothetical protein